MTLINIQNLVKMLNDETKKDYFKTLHPSKIDINKKFWKTFKPFFPSKDTPSEKMIIVEKVSGLSDDKEVAECMNNYFVNITEKWPENITNIPKP